MGRVITLSKNGEICQMRFPQETTDNINKIFETATEDGRDCLYEYEVYGILKEIGLDVPEFVMVEHPSLVDEKVLKKFNRSLVAKIVSPQIAHKQKLGGVKIITNLDPSIVQFVLARMREEVLSHYLDDGKPEIKGFLLTEFVPHTEAIGYEVLMGFKEDAAFWTRAHAEQGRGRRRILCQILRPGKPLPAAPEPG